MKKTPFIASLMTMLAALTGINIAYAQTSVSDLVYHSATQYNTPAKATVAPAFTTTSYTSAPAASSGYVDGHEYVDLGLPSGTKWATCNLGASSSSGYGDYFAWGETTTKSSYSSSTSKWRNVSYSSLKSQGVIDSNGNLKPRYDAATQKWGSEWRMPTKDEVMELQNRCTWTWTTVGGNNGYRVTGPNGNYIFLPAAGWQGSSGMYSRDSNGDYWSATACNDEESAYFFKFDNANHSTDTEKRNFGQSIRPVTSAGGYQSQSSSRDSYKTIDSSSSSSSSSTRSRSTTGSLNGHEWVDLGLPSGLKWATCNIGANSPNRFGYYITWGETSTKSSYTKSNSKWFRVDHSDLISRNVVDSNGNLRPQYDAARQNWGSTWRMPTRDEIDELVKECEWEWTYLGGQNGYRITGPNGNSIFLPTGGCYSGSEIICVDALGRYWSATADGSDDGAYGISFSESEHDRTDYYRVDGHLIRPVTF